MAYEDGFWLFGYGSLIWKPPPKYDERLPGYIEGFVRRFWQASEDHRGTPSAPGRVVTLIDYAFYATLADDATHLSHEDEKVWGAAYHIPAQHAQEMIDYLEIREQGGYVAQWTTFHVANSAGAPKDHGSAANGTDDAKATKQEQTKHTLQCMVYIGLPTNPHFTGPQMPQQLAEHILHSHGPSGANKEYLYMLEQSLGQLDPQLGLAEIDFHVGDLVRRCRLLERERAVEGDEVQEVSGSGTGAVISDDKREGIEKS